jgi:molybdopterin synthase sulfur carrier subunit
VNLTVALFGIAREIVGKPSLEMSVPAGQSAAGLLAELRAQYPALAGLRSLAVAVNNEYAAEDVALHERDEIALIPPVSGG